MANRADNKRNREIADKYVGVARCTLNGKDARIVGRLNQFATIGTLDGSTTAEYAWQTVERIMQRDSKFYV